MKRNKFWNKFTEDMMMNSKTAKDFSYWGKMRNLELKCELENWNLFDCTKTGKIIPLNKYYTTKEIKKMETTQKTPDTEKEFKKAVEMLQRAIIEMDKIGTERAKKWRNELINKQNKITHERDEKKRIALIRNAMKNENNIKNCIEFAKKEKEAETK